MSAAAATDSPVILQASAGARSYAGEPFLRHLVLAAAKAYPDIPIVWHQDHGASPAVCQASIRSGFTSVMIDGSLLPDMKTPSTYDYNVATTSRRTRSGCPSRGSSVSSARSRPVAPARRTARGPRACSHALLTDPDDAAAFVEATEVDALAVAIGTSHGAYKFTRKPTGEILAIDRIKEIHARLPDTHLVMHGSSSVPQEWLQVIRTFGGEIPETYGVPVEQIREGIRHGVRKVNIDTDLRLAMTGAIRRFLAEHPGEFDPRRYFKVAIAAARDLCVARYEAFGSAGQASRLSPVPVELTTPHP
jgi:fructose-bisphosphate aldolase class II